MRDSTQGNLVEDVGNPGEESESEKGLVFDDTSEKDIISARGTEDGLFIRIDGRAEWPEIVQDLTSFLEQRRNFLQGGEVFLEWLDCLPTKEQSQELEDLFKNNFDISIAQPKRKAPKFTAHANPKFVEKAKKGQVNPDTSNVDEISRVAEEIIEAEANRRREEYLEELSAEEIQKMTEMLGEEGFLEEEPNCRVIFGTLRSGQRVETPFSLVVVGDVNPGADLVAGGDIVVFGSLRGTAHASAYEEESQGSTIIALHMQPMQLRIGSVISRGSDEPSRGPEVARIDERRIIVEAFNPRHALHSKKVSPF